MKVCWKMFLSPKSLMSWRCTFWNICKSWLLQFGGFFTSQHLHRQNTETPVQLWQNNILIQLNTCFVNQKLEHHIRTLEKHKWLTPSHYKYITTQKIYIAETYNKYTNTWENTIINKPTHQTHQTHQTQQHIRSDTTNQQNHIRKLSKLDSSVCLCWNVEPGLIQLIVRV